MKLSKNARYILDQRYLLRDENRNIIETPTQLFRRVARAIANVELEYGKSKSEVKSLEREFYKMMTNFIFLPNSPTLMNAGTDIGLLSACFVIPVGDDIDEIFDAVHYTAQIQKGGGGTGFSFSRLRPKDDVVKSTGGVASGPLSFMQVFNAATDVIKQGGKRRGANLGCLRCDHPDVFDFIVCKEREGMLKNFNLSVTVTDKFMKAIEEDTDFHLVNPRTKRSVKTIKARSLWILLLTMSWKNGEPAVLFIDRLNEFNPTPDLGVIESTNPCGEQPLLPYESCNLGSINLNKFYKNRKKNSDDIDWKKLKKIVRLATRFLDNVVDANNYPLEQIQKATLGNRKIGLGVMGWADLLLQLGIRYDSAKAVALGKKIMKFIRDEGMQMSRELGKEKGSFPNKENSIYKDKPYIRNATITTVAPTGTIALIANCSNGIEPIFALVQKRHVKGTLGKDLIEVNPAVKRSLELKDLWNPEIEEALAKDGIKNNSHIPDKMKRAFVTSFDVSPEWHVKMQAAFQEFTHNAVSKTINLPNHATIHDIEKIYLLAYSLGCKGITVYRDGSRTKQLLTRK